MTFSAHRAARSFPQIQQGLRTSAEGLGQHYRGGGAGVRGILPESSTGLGTRAAHASVEARRGLGSSLSVSFSPWTPPSFLSAFLPPSRTGPYGSAHVSPRPHRLSDSGKLAPPPRARVGGTAGRTGHVQDLAAPTLLLGVFPEPRAGRVLWQVGRTLRSPRPATWQALCDQRSSFLFNTNIWDGVGGLDIISSILLMEEN